MVQSKADEDRACFCFFRLRKKSGDHYLIIVSWLAIVILRLTLWLHANPGGWQFSYRYGMILLPWMFLILLINGKRRSSLLEVALFLLSVGLTLLRLVCFFGLTTSDLTSNLEN